jgi:hypothetical protein
VVQSRTTGWALWLAGKLGRFRDQFYCRVAQDSLIREWKAVNATIYGTIVFAEFNHQ